MKKQTLLQEVKQLQKVAGLLRESTEDDIDLSDTPKFSSHIREVEKVFKKADIDFNKPVYIVDFGDTQDRETSGIYLNSNFENVREPAEVNVPMLIQHIAQLEEATPEARITYRYPGINTGYPDINTIAPEKVDLPSNLTEKLEIWFFNEFCNSVYQ